MKGAYAEALGASMDAYGRYHLITFLSFPTWQSAIGLGSLQQLISTDVMRNQFCCTCLTGIKRLEILNEHI